MLDKNFVKLARETKFFGFVKSKLDKSARVVAALALILGKYEIIWRS